MIVGAADTLCRVAGSEVFLSTRSEAKGTYVVVDQPRYETCRSDVERVTVRR